MTLCGPVTGAYAVLWVIHLTSVRQRLREINPENPRNSGVVKDFHIRDSERHPPTLDSLEFACKALYVIKGSRKLNG
jgi:hypothetical protein